MALDAGTIMAALELDMSGFLAAVDEASMRLDALAAALPAQVGGALLEGEALCAAAATTLLEAIHAPLSVLPDTLHALGNQSVQHMAAGVAGGAPTLQAASGSAGAGAVAAMSAQLSPGMGRAIGAGMVDGVIAGVHSRSGALYSAVTSVARTAVARMRSALSIHSPSAVFAEQVGAWIPAGVGEGIRRHAQDALAPLDALRERMTEDWDARTARAVAVAPSPPGNDVRQTVNVYVTGAWHVRDEQDKRDVIEAVTARMQEELRRR